MSLNTWDTMSLESILYPAAYRKAGVRRMSEVVTPRLLPIMSFEMPLASVYHHLDVDDVSLGPTRDHVMLKSYSGRMLIKHIGVLKDPIGNPRPARGRTETILTTEYKRKQRLFRPLNNYERSIRDRNTLAIFNYSFLHQVAFYPASRYAGYYKQRNVYHTLFYQLNETLKVGDRQHFLHVELPHRIPGFKILSKTSKNVKSWEGSLLQAFSKPKLHMLHILWNWLGKNRAVSDMSQIESEYLGRVNLVITDNGKYCIVNLNTLLEATGNEIENEDDVGSTVLQRRFFAMLQYIVSLRSDATPPTDDETELDDETVADPTSPTKTNEEESKTTTPTDRSPLDDLEDVIPPDDIDEMDDVIDTSEETPKDIKILTDGKLDDEDIFNDEGLDDIELLLEDEEDLNIDDEVRGGDYKEPNDVLLKRIENLANSGRISVGEYKRYQRIAEKSKNLPNPFGEGLLSDFKEIKPEELSLSEEDTKIVDIKGVLDKTMLGSSTDAYDDKYITKVLDKDIANLMMEPQRAGVAVTDFKVETHRDVSNDYRVFTMRMAPIEGEVSTIHQRIPNIKPDGTFMANGVKYTMKKQRRDLPIRKINPGKVALTTYYAKVFVDRSERSVVNYSRWLLNQINLISLDNEDDRIKDARSISVFNHNVDVPRVYSILGQRFREFKVKGGYYFNFDFDARKKTFGEEAVLEAENGDHVVIGKKGSKLVVVDKTDMFYLYSDGDVSELGTIETLVGLDAAKAPVEIAEFQLFSKSVPVGIALGLHYGLRDLMDTLKVTPRRVPNGTRAILEDHEYGIRFADETLIFSKDDRVATLVLAGFNRYHREIARYDVDSFNKNDVYMNILENNKIRVGFIRELDLAMDMFVDPITREILESMKEPTSLDKLLIRSCELLLTDWHPLENDRAHQRDVGYERVAGAMYTEVVRAIRRYRSRGAGALPKIELNPEATWYAINTDASVVQIEESNPIHNLKEKEAVTYSGTGGRSDRSMVKRTRSFTKSDMGLTSEATTDSGTVGVNFSLPPDPNITDVRGMGVSLGERAASKPSSMVSTAALIAPCSDHDD